MGICFNKGNSKIVINTPTLKKKPHKQSIPSKRLTNKSRNILKALGYSLVK